MSLYYLFFILPITLIIIWNIIIPKSAEDIGFDLPMGIKIAFLVFPWNVDITLTLIINNIINVCIVIFAIIFRLIIVDNLRDNTVILVVYELINLTIMFILLWKYGTKKRVSDVTIKDLFSLKKIEGIYISANEEYSCKYEYLFNRNMTPTKVFIILPDSLFTTTIDGDLKASPCAKDKTEIYNVGAYKGLAENIALAGYGVLKMERLSPYVLEEVNIKYLSDTFKEILFRVKAPNNIVLFFHGDNNGLIFEMCKIFQTATIISACNCQIALEENYFDKIKKLTDEHKVLFIEAKYNPRIKAKYKKKVVLLKSLNAEYCYFEKMDFTLRERDSNQLNGGVTIFGREIGQGCLKDVYKPLTNEIVGFMGRV